jgi:hypothetical protein
MHQTVKTVVFWMGTCAPLILLGALWFVMVRQMQRGKAPTGSGGGLNCSGTTRLNNGNANMSQ